MKCKTLSLEELKVGDKCKTRQGDIVTIVEIRNNAVYPISGDDGVTRTSGGYQFHDSLGQSTSRFDLMYRLPVIPHTSETQLEHKTAREPVISEQRAQIAKDIFLGFTNTPVNQGLEVEFLMDEAIKLADLFIDKLNK